MAEPQISKTFPVKPKLKPNPKNPSSTPESKYWRSFKPHQISDLIYAVTSLAFSPAAPHPFAATFSASLAIFDSSSASFEQKASISSFSDVAYSAAFRSDGKLLAAGGHSGLVQVFDAKTRTALRRLRGHSRPARLVRYPRLDRLHLFSGADDALVKYWDIAAATQLLGFEGHKDYVRCGDGSPASSEIFASGSYDHTIRVWDVRVSGSSSVMEVNHGKPVEDLIFLPSGGLLATAGGNVVKIWDVIGGGRLVHTMESHTKTVTSICVGKIGRDLGEESEKNRILSVGLDGYFKVFDYAKMKITHSMKFPAPLMSVAFSPDCSARVIGTSNGIIYAGKRKKGKTGEAESGDFAGFGPIAEPEKRVLRPTNFRYFQRGQSEKPSEGDYLVMRQKKVKLSEHDRLLKKFRHREALVSALKGQHPGNVVAVMEELVARKKLLKCVANLDNEELGLLLSFLQRNATMPQYSNFLIGLARKVVEMRIEDIRASESLKVHLLNLKGSVEEEIRIQQSLQEIQGVISPLLRIAGRR